MIFELGWRISAHSYVTDMECGWGGTKRIGQRKEEGLGAVVNL